MKKYKKLLEKINFLGSPYNNQDKQGTMFALMFDITLIYKQTHVDVYVYLLHCVVKMSWTCGRLRTIYT